MGRDLYVALGDSITIGYGASHQRLAFISQLVEWTRQNQGFARPISRATVVEAIERFRESYEYFCRFIQSKGYLML